MYSRVLSMIALTASLVSGVYGGIRYQYYFDRNHLNTFPDRQISRLTTHAVLAYEDPDAFAQDEFSPPEPIIPFPKVRGLFTDPIKVCLSIGGLNKAVSFWEAANSEHNRTRFASNVKKTVDKYGYDCVEIAWAMPGGNGAGFNQIPVPGIQSSPNHLPDLLATLKKSTKELSIMVPGRDMDMGAFDTTTVKKIGRLVDYVTVKTFDLADGRDATSNHTAGFGAVGESLKRYIDLGVPSIKLNLGFAYYATWQRVEPGAMCLLATMCPILKTGSPAENTGFVTFEKQNLEPNPPGIDPVIATSFQKAMREGQVDVAMGGWWWHDEENNLFWSWETADIIYHKCLAFIPSLGLGGLSSYSATMDSASWQRMVKSALGVSWIPGDFFDDLERQLAEDEKRWAHEEL